MTFAKDFENGKRVRFQKDAENPTAAGPDAEGISVDDIITTLWVCASPATLLQDKNKFIIIL